MSACEFCGTACDTTIELIQNGRVHLFDCFECAAQALAPVCDHCGCKILGHGFQVGGLTFCSERCSVFSGLRCRARVPCSIHPMEAAVAG